VDDTTPHEERTRIGSRQEGSPVNLARFRRTSTMARGAEVAFRAGMSARKGAEMQYWRYR